MSALGEADPEVYAAVQGEEARQRDQVILIASENTVSRAVREAAGSVMTSKYAEGYPGRRYYGGCQFVDEAERLAQDRARRLFGAEHVNVQPHSGATANTAVYFALLEPGDGILSMDLNHGGHLSHGHPKNYTGRFYRIARYGVHPDTERIDMEEVARAAAEHRPRLIIAGASAYSRLIDFEGFRRVADGVGALLMVDMAHVAGLVAARLHPDPVPWAHVVTTTTHKTLRGPRGGMILCKEDHARAIDSALFPGIQGGPLMHLVAAKAVALKEALAPSFRDYQARVLANARSMAAAMAEGGCRVVSGGTDNHLFLVDLRPLGVTGKDAEAALGAAGITVNKNLIPNDPAKPTVTSGLRIGTPTVSSRGMGEPEVRQVAAWICEAIRRREDAAFLEGLRREVAALCARFPLP
ncbi:MAG: serine hydroxymethyltransferase [Planctomycetes bacterium]|nr:serine hydroxymethyltransferase [Planctomycetota bacterium]